MVFSITKDIPNSCNKLIIIKIFFALPSFANGGHFVIDQHKTACKIHHFVAYTSVQRIYKLDKITLCFFIHSPDIFNISLIDVELHKIEENLEQINNKINRAILEPTKHDL